jgi:hypothetical protein
VAVSAYLKNRCIEKMGIFTGMLVVAAAASCDDLVNILLVELLLVVTGIAKVRRFLDKEHVEV